jgi:hypothetical protein
MWAVGLTEPERFDERCNVTEVKRQRTLAPASTVPLILNEHANFLEFRIAYVATLYSVCATLHDA